MNRSEANEKAKQQISNAGFGTGTNITTHALKCMMVDFYLDNSKSQESDSLPCGSPRDYDPNFDEVDCEHYEYEVGMEDNAEMCQKGIGIENCNHCIFNKALHGC